MSSASPLYLLDTNILLYLIRGQELGQYIDTTYSLRAQPQRPLVCVVSHGETWTLARRNRWGDEKREALRLMLTNLVTVDLHHDDVIEAYVEIEEAADQRPAGAANMGKNDVWIAAVAKVSGATLLTTDHDFDFLFGTHIQGVRIDPSSKLPKPTK